MVVKSLFFGKYKFLFEVGVADFAVKLKTNVG